MRRPADWLKWINEPQTAKELAELRESARRGCPFGGPAWQAETAARLKLQSTFRPPGRPKKKAEPEKAKKRLNKRCISPFLVVLDAYNLDLRVQCGPCNMSHQFEGVAGAYQYGVDGAGNPLPAPSGGPK